MLFNGASRWAGRKENFCAFLEQKGKKCFQKLCQIWKIMIFRSKLQSLWHFKKSSFESSSRVDPLPRFFCTHFENFPITFSVPSDNRSPPARGRGKKWFWPRRVEKTCFLTFLISFVTFLTFLRPKLQICRASFQFYVVSGPKLNKANFRKSFFFKRSDFWQIENNSMSLRKKCRNFPSFLPAPSPTKNHLKFLLTQQKAAQKNGFSKT